MKYQQGISTIVVVGLLVLCVVVMMFISLAVTSEGNASWQPTPEQQQAIQQYYQRCPLKKAELNDLTSANSIRKVVEFRSVTCDEETSKEQAVVHVVSQDESEGKKQFESWLNEHQLDLSKVKVVYE